MRRALRERALCAVAAAAALTVLTGCGQKGALYLPDKNAAVVTSAPPPPESPTPSAPAPQPPAEAAPAPSSPESPAPPKKDESEGDSTAPQ